jgi:hypothetical protein
MTNSKAPRFSEPDDSETISEQKEAVAHLLASATLERSPRARELLEYLAECRFSGRVGDVKEQIIGERLFKRAPGYNSAEDNIVRVAARQLRSKLSEYYDSEGRTADWVLEIPKGGYLPKFCSRELASSIAAVEPALPVGVPAGGYRRSIVPWMISAALAIALAWSLTQKRDPRAVPAPQTPATLVRLLAPKPGQHLNIVVVDASLQMYRTITGRTIPLAEYTGQSYWKSQDLPPMFAEGSALGRYLSREVVTQHYCVPAIARIFESVPIGQLSFRHPTEMSKRDFQTDNALLIGGPFTNPWAQLFEDTLSFQIEPTPGKTFSRIRNVAPAAGEQKMYVDDAARATYARISYRPNLNGTGVVLLVAGPGIPATEAAGRFVADPNELGQVLALMGVRNLRDLPSFDLVLEVTTRADRASETRIAAWRRVDR